MASGAIQPFSDMNTADLFMRFTSNAGSSIFDFVSTEDVKIPAHAEVALASLTCSPNRKVLVLDDGNRNIVFTFTEGQLREAFLPRGPVLASKFDDFLLTMKDSFTLGLQYSGFDMGMNLSFGRNFGKITYGIERYFDEDARTPAWVLLDRGVADPAADDFRVIERDADAPDDPCFVLGNFPVGDVSFVRASFDYTQADISATVGWGFTAIHDPDLAAFPITEDASDFVYGFRYEKAARQFTVYKDGASIVQFNPDLDFSLIEVRRFGNLFEIIAYGDLGEPVTLDRRPVIVGFDDPTAELYAAYVIETPSNFNVRLLNCRYICKNILEDGPLPAPDPPAITPDGNEFLGAVCVFRNNPNAITLKMSDELASYLGLIQQGIDKQFGPVTWASGQVDGDPYAFFYIFPELYASHYDSESIMVACDEPFHTRAHIMSTDQADGSGVYSLIAVVTPPRPEDNPMQWSASVPTYLRVNNAHPITARRFRFRLLNGDRTPLSLNGPSHMTLLVRSPFFNAKA